MSEPHAIEPTTTPHPVMPGVTVMSDEPNSTNTAATVESAAFQAAKPDAVTTTKQSPESWLWLSRLDQTFVTVFAAVFLALVGYHWATLGGWGMQPIEINRLPERKYDFRIDMNSASWVEWTQIEGIGEVTANKIIADRESNGAFRKIDDLLRVKGIGPKTLEKMRPYLREPNEQTSSQ